MLSDSREVTFECPGCSAQIHSVLGYLRHSDEIRCLGCGKWIEIRRRKPAPRADQSEHAAADRTFWRSFLRTLNEPAAPSQTPRHLPQSDQLSSFQEGP